MKPENYVYSPNNIHPEIRNNGGKEIYPSGPNIPCLPNCLIAADMEDYIGIYARVYGGNSIVLVSKLSSTKAFINYCKEQGKISEGGQPTPYF